MQNRKATLLTKGSEVFNLIKFVIFEALALHLARIDAEKASRKSLNEVFSY